MLNIEYERSVCLTEKVRNTFTHKPNCFRALMHAIDVRKERGLVCKIDMWLRHPCWGSIPDVSNCIENTSVSMLRTFLTQISSNNIMRKYENYHCLLNQADIDML